MQSGITASADLKTAFSTLLTSPSQRGLIATISPSPESLTPSHVLPASGTFTADLVQLAPLLSDTQAAYLILKADDASRKCVAVTFVPDAANVRQKMLFASTRLTLVRELGTEHFGSTLFATAKAELTAAGWERHEAHGSLAAPLTQEERDLVGIKEAEAQESMGTGARRGHVQKGVSLPVGEQAQQALGALKAGDVGLVQLAIDVPKETLVLAATTPAHDASPAALGKLIAHDAPRYSIYRHVPSASEPVFLFIYTCPTASNIKERMLYATTRNSMIHVVLPEAGIDVTKRLEATNPDEISVEDVLAEVEPEGQQSVATSSAGTSRGFARPKRPGKR